MEFWSSRLGAGFLLQHAVQGWCRPVPIFRRLGIRTASEIDAERYALRMIRGDFGNLPKNKDGLVERDIGHIVKAVTP